MLKLGQGTRWLAAGLGSGWLPGAPGTWGSLASLPFAWLILDHAGIAALLIASVLLVVAGCIICRAVLENASEKDPGWIVIDEWAGQWLCLVLGSLALERGLMLLAGSFIMFRLFDIAKPWPVSLSENWGPSWWSIMADDLVAGLLGGASLAAGVILLGGGS